MGRLIRDHEGAVYRHHWVSAQDGLRLWVREYGPRTGPEILCLAGMTRNSRDFHTLASRLSDTYRIIVPDYRGRGQSGRDANWRNYAPTVYLSDIQHVLIALGVGRCAVIGTSLGGLLGLAFGVAMPGRLKGVLLNDIGPEVPAAAIADVQRGLGDQDQPETWEAAVQHLKTRFPELPAEDDDDWRVIAEASYRKTSSGALERDWDPAITRAFSSTPPDSDALWRLYRSVDRRPLALIRGAFSPFIDEDLLSRMTAVRPDMISGLVADVGHVPSLMDDVSSTVIDAWLQRCVEDRAA